MKATLVACVLLAHDQKYLLVQQARGRRQPGQWGPPGGKPDLGESLAEAARRETAEETGLAVELTGFVGLVQSGHREDPNLFACFAGSLGDQTNVPDLTHLKLPEAEISGAQWLSLAEIEAGVVTLRAQPFVGLFRRHHSGLIYPLDLIETEPLYSL